MNATEIAEKCMKRFNELTADVDNTTRWEAADELQAGLEGVTMERSEQAE